MQVKTLYFPLLALAFALCFTSLPVTAVDFPGQALPGSVLAFFQENVPLKRRDEGETDLGFFGPLGEVARHYGGTLMEGAAALSKDTREEIGELGASMNIVEGETDLGLLGDAARRYGETLIEGAAAMSKDAREKIGALRERMNTVVQAARALHDDIQATMLEKRQIDSDTNDATESAGDFSGDLERAFGTVLDEMQVIFPAPEEALVHGERQKVVAATLDKVGTALVTVCVKYKMDEERVRSLWEVIREAIEKLIVLLGDVAEQHPLLIEVLLFAFMLLVSDQIWFLRRLLRILGFGQAGPMKGTAASWAQRVFYGPAVSKGSWFSFLQKTAMGG